MRCNDDANGTVQSSLTFTANANTTYYIGVSNYAGRIQSAGLDVARIKPEPEINAQLTISTKLHAMTFADVLPDTWYWRYVEGFYVEGITTGCAAGPLQYCPNRAVTRAEMSVFLLRAKNGLSIPVPSQSGMFTDVPVSGKEWMKPWIEEFYGEGITTGCSAGPLQYCPERQVTRAEMAVFVLRAKHGASYQPPTATGVFSDVPVSGKDAAMDRGILPGGDNDGMCTEPFEVLSGAECDEGRNGNVY